MIQTQTSAASTFRSLIPAALVAVVTLAAGVSTLYAAPTRGEMAVVFPPWVSATDAYGRILAAGGQFVANSRFDNVAIAFAPDQAFKARASAAGALLFLAATGLCGPVLQSNPISQEPT